jgi:phosphoglycolate phosphatase-like HAD superfamily hydrolase
LEHWQGLFGDALTLVQGDAKTVEECGRDRIVEALRRLNGIAACSALVGDQPSDMAAARAAGLGTAVLIDRTGAANVDSVDADAVVRTLGEAVAFLT